jgi:hypothetical protein
VHHQVKVVAILMIVQGAMECLYGLMFVAMGPVMLAIIANDPGTGSPPPPAWIAGIYPVLGLPALVAGALKIWAGILNLKLRGRTLGIVGLFSGLLTIMSCAIYCFPTSLALMIYGLIVYFDSDTARAFTIAEDRVPPDEALQRVDREREDRLRQMYR